MTTKTKAKEALKLFQALLLSVSSVFMVSQASAQQAQQLYDNHIHEDMLPEFAGAGSHKVGVRTVTITNPNHFDPFTQSTAARNLPIELWYPSKTESQDLTSYDNELRSGIKFSMQGSAMRDVDFDDSEQWPLVVLSHGYTGYRTIMYYLGEHLASHGYVVVGIDHTDSTNEEIDIANAPFAGFMSTLLNRSRDQQFVLDYLSNIANVKQALGKNAKWQADIAGVVGYSMGGYGALSTVGACYDFPASLLAGFIQSDDQTRIKGMQMALNTCSAGQYPEAMTGKKVETDPRWKAMMAFAPWGGQHKLFSYDSLANIQVPSMLVSGDLDDVSIYAGIQDIFAQYKSNDHYLLTYINARHNIAPHPAPKEAWSAEIDYGHYYEPAWSSQRLNQLNKHFVLVMMDCYLKQDKQTCSFLDLSEHSNQVQSEPGLAPPWKGFDNRYSTGMSFKRGNAKNP